MTFTYFSLICIDVSLISIESLQVAIEFHRCSLIPSMSIVFHRLFIDSYRFPSILLHSHRFPPDPINPSNLPGPNNLPDPPNPPDPASPPNPPSNPQRIQASNHPNWDGGMRGAIE